LGFYLIITRTTDSCPILPIHHQATR
jgi:hypothetical protein